MGFFSKWRPSTIMDLLGTYWYHARWPTDSLRQIWLNLCCSFDNMKLSIFCHFGLKTPIYAPKIDFFPGISPPKIMSSINELPKGTPLRESASFEPWSVKIRRRVWPVGEFMKKGINEWINKIFVIFHPFAQKTHGQICTKFGTAVEAADVITCAIFFWSVKGCGFCGGRKLLSPIGIARCR